MTEVRWHYCADVEEADAADYGTLEDNVCDECGERIGQYITGGRMPSDPEQYHYRGFWWTNDIGARAGVDDTLLCDGCLADWMEADKAYQATTEDECAL